MTAILKYFDNSLFRGGFAPSSEAKTLELAQRLQALLADPNHQRQSQAQMRLAIVSILLSVAGAALSFSQLIFGKLAPPADAFWLLCAALSVALFCVAEVVLVSRLISQFAMQRLALGGKEFEVYEAVREYERLQESISALNELTRRRGFKPTAAAMPLFVETVAFITLASGLAGADDLEQRALAIWRSWRDKGADDELLAKLTMRGSVED